MDVLVCTVPLVLCGENRKIFLDVIVLVERKCPIFLDLFLTCSDATEMIAV